MKTSEQIGALYLAMQFVKQRRVAVDVGANRGDWTEALWNEDKGFERTIAIEPAQDMFKLLLERLLWCNKIDLLNVAAWSHFEMVDIFEPPKRKGQARARYVNYGTRIPAMPLDGLDLKNCDLLKIDVEGAEARVLTGAYQTLMRCKPVVIVECKDLHSKYYPDEELPRPEYQLTHWGAKQLAEHGPDKIFGWPE